MTPETDVRHRTGRGWLPAALRGRHMQRWLHVSLPLLIAFSVAQLSKSSIGVIVADRAFSHQFGLDIHPGSVGWLTSLFLYAYGIALFAWGFVLKRLGPRTSMLIGTGIWVVALALPPFVNSLSELYGTRILLAIGEACFYPVAHTLTARWFPMKERARANASWLSGIFVGSALGSVLTTTMLSAFSWRATFLVQAADRRWCSRSAWCWPCSRTGPTQAHGRERGRGRAHRRRPVRVDHGRAEAGSRVAVPQLPLLADDADVRRHERPVLRARRPGCRSTSSRSATSKLGDIGIVLTVANVLSIVVMVLVGRASDRTVKRAGWAAMGFVIEGVGIAGTALFGQRGRRQLLHLPRAGRATPGAWSPTGPCCTA